MRLLGEDIPYVSRGGLKLENALSIGRSTCKAKPVSIWAPQPEASAIACCSTAPPLYLRSIPATARSIPVARPARCGCWRKPTPAISNRPMPGTDRIHCHGCLVHFRDAGAAGGVRAAFAGGRRSGRKNRGPGEAAVRSGQGRWAREASCATNRRSGQPWSE